MKYGVFILLGLLLLKLNAGAQYILTPDYIVVSGYVKDAQTDSVLPLVNVFNPRTHKGTITDNSGFFRYYAFRGDTLILSSMGYVKSYIPVSDTTYHPITDIFYMHQDVFNIPEVNICGLSRYEQLRYDIKHLGNASKPVLNARKNLPEINHDVLSFSSRRTDNFGVVASPITALYNAFSKEGREQRKLLELRRQDALKKAIEPHFNKEMVMRITGLPPEEAEEFMAFCNFSPHFLLNTSDYIIVKQIIKKFEIYTLTHKSDNSN
ncbi:MAG: carboxypeptidase-like regulatory domain-containing protein [Bacteroidales bacterium]